MPFPQESLLSPAPTIKRTPVKDAPSLCTTNLSDHGSTGLYFNHLFSYQYLLVDRTLSDEKGWIILFP